MSNVDLHCHSTWSDGTLAPAALIARAKANGVEMLALTDHDHLGGLREAAQHAQKLGVQFISGVEVSISWRHQTIHVVGLGIDPDHVGLQAGLAQVRSGRDQRARRMADALSAAGIPGAFEGALRYCGNVALLGRSHFARYIVEKGFACDTKAVFEQYLVPGKPGYVEHEWATLPEAVGWIIAAGGLPVLAHPARYKLSPQAMTQFLDAFKACGGQGIEVSSGAHSEDDIRRFARVARDYGFLASRASDFHSPEESGTDLGGAPALPPGLKAVWDHLPRRA
ncbi:MAG: hypothetical protein RIR70_1856 [Pseudomonadota bacterium]